MKWTNVRDGKMAPNESFMGRRDGYIAWNGRTLEMERRHGRRSVRRRPKDDTME